ncbi:MAG: hypothetical protein WC045_00875 [Patescibacteria group bacterium]
MKKKASKAPSQPANKRLRSALAVCQETQVKVYDQITEHIKKIRGQMAFSLYGAGETVLLSSAQPEKTTTGIAILWTHQSNLPQHLNHRLVFVPNTQIYSHDTRPKEMLVLDISQCDLPNKHGLRERLKEIDKLQKQNNELFNDLGKLRKLQKYSDKDVKRVVPDWSPDREVLRRHGFRI